MMRNPELLTFVQSGSITSVEPEAVLLPETMSLSMRVEGLSTANITLGQGNPDVAIGKWLRVYAPNGEMCYMYVKNRKRDYTTGQITLSCEHIFGLLADMIAFGEITPATITGSSSATKVFPDVAIDYLLDKQVFMIGQTSSNKIFALTECDYSSGDDNEQGWKFLNSDIYSALNSIAETLEDCQWEFDFTYALLPFGLKLKQIPDEATMEMRRDRNIESLNITVDKNQMYTRAYPTGKNDIHIDSVNSNRSYVDADTTGTYGIIGKVITDSTIDNAKLLKKWAKKQVKRNGVPKTTISITGYDLSEATGESLDKLTTGRLCRVPIPEYFTEPVVERLVELNWRDCINAPMSVNCTLANELTTMTRVLIEQVKKSGGAGSRRANTEHDNELGKHKTTLGNHESAIIQNVRITGPTNNEYKLQYQKYGSSTWTDAGTFSRAVASLNWSWSNGTLTITPQPQNQNFTLGTLAAGSRQNADGTPYTTGNTWYVPILFNYGGSGQYSESTGWRVYVDASGRDAASGSASGRHGSGYSWDFLITRGDGSTKTLTIDCSAIYTDARSGYTQGTFVSAGAIAVQGSATSSLTLQGTQHIVTPISSTSVRLGSSKTVYKRSSSTYTVQGSKGPKLYHYGQASLTTTGGTTLNQDWYYVSTSSRADQYYNEGTTNRYAAEEDGSARPVVTSGGTVYYTAGSELTLYDAGNNVGVLYNAGTIRNDLYVKTS